MELTKEQIDRINKAAPMKWQENEQGIFTQPWGIPDDIKEPVIYMRWEKGGVNGGSYDDSSNPQPYVCEGGEPKFDVLDLTLKELCPHITYLQFREIENLIKSNEKTEWEYYGNRTDFGIKFIVLSDLINYLNEQV